MSELKEIAWILKNIGYVTKILPDDNMEHGYVVVNNIWQIFLAADLKEADLSSRFIKFAAQLPYSPTADQLPDVFQAIAILNERLQIGRFGINVEKMQLSYKYILSMPNNTAISPELLTELMALMMFEQEYFGDYLEGVCHHEISVFILDDLIDQTSDEK